MDIDGQNGANCYHRNAPVNFNLIISSPELQRGEDLSSAYIVCVCQLYTFLSFSPNHLLYNLLIFQNLLFRNQMCDQIFTLQEFSLYGPLNIWVFLVSIRNPRWSPLDDKVLTQNPMGKIFLNYSSVKPLNHLKQSWLKYSLDGPLQNVFFVSIRNQRHESYKPFHSNLYLSVPGWYILKCMFYVRIRISMQDVHHCMTKFKYRNLQENENNDNIHMTGAK